MKKILSLLLLVICLCGLIVCGRDSAPEAQIDYGSSAIYKKEDMDAAIKLIKKEFSTWDGCELHSITYSSDDECNPENITWMNELAAANASSGNFTQCIMFISNFHSPKNGNGDGGWNEDEEYTDWQWWLAREDGGEWQLLTWGY